MWPLPELSSEILIPHNNTKNDENNSPLPPLILTHDVDTQFGFDHIMDVCEVEKRLGFKGSWNIVPDLYEVDESVLDYLRDSGMEIGVHDWNHDGRLFSDKKIFDERVTKINRVMKRWGAKGFRAGMVFHNDEWMQQLDCEYDSSYYDTDPFQPMGGGCGKIRPFTLGHLVELPYTMPQDHVLFVARAEVRVPLNYDDDDVQRRANWKWIHRYLERNELATDTHRHTQTFVRRTPVPSPGATGQASPGKNGHRFAEKYQKKSMQAKAVDGIVLRGVDIWKMKAEWLVEHGGMVLMITHPDYLCHPRLVKRKEVTPVESTSGCSSRSNSTGQGGRRSERKHIYDGWLGEDDRDVVEVRDKGIIGEKWYGSLLEQYAAFLSWFKREYKDMYWHCLAREIDPQITQIN